eukprot:CAMPEP_0178385470 /NCGR_PEP_ID=MMETSP0689_2-20121128/8048_1 /TAXON_ID=160604 /ORGANISM="Amphidinium massartii, Strain CS-259" /LENGTH=396 /DNA_ID=CAMNT_0020005751 /DNA_START=60 /DNA_END=1247 /DNA_ORIENTATION=-
MPAIDYSKFDKIEDSDDEEKAPPKKPENLAKDPPGAKAKPSPPLSQPKRQRLVGVLSSHIGTQQRLERLKDLFGSIAQQSEPLDTMFMVWSAPSEELRGGVEAAVEQLRRACGQRCPVTTLRQTKRTSQFYDIRWLWDELLSKEASGTWVLFTDDDDLWANRRVQTYKTNLARFANQPSVTGLCATHKVRPTSRKLVARTSAEITEHLSSGKAIHCGGVHKEEEFFDFACPLASLGEFLKMCNEETLLHPFCDLRFSRFLQEYYEGGKVMYMPTDSHESWVYYYSTAYRTPSDEETYQQFVAQEQASTVLKLRAEDEVEAKELLRQSTAAGGASPTTQDIEEMVDFVATLRQNIEAVLIRHFPEEPLSVSRLKRIAVEQAQGQVFGLRLADKLARE